MPDEKIPSEHLARSLSALMLNQSDLARKMGIDPSHISRALKEPYVPARYIEGIDKALGTRDWRLPTLLEKGLTIGVRIGSPEKLVALGRRIAGLRTAAGIETQADLAAALKKVGINRDRSWVSALETGRIKRPEPDELRRLAVFFKISVDDLTAELGPEEPEEMGHSLVREVAPMDLAPGMALARIPYYGTVAADCFDFNFDQAPESFLNFEVQVPKGVKVGSFKISGKCMEPKIFEGDTIVVIAADTIAQGKVGVFRLDGGCTVKRFFRRDDHVELVPDNKKFKTIKLATNKLEIIGRVYKVIRDVE